MSEPPTEPPTQPPAGWSAPGDPDRPLAPPPPSAPPVPPPPPGYGYGTPPPPPPGYGYGGPPPGYAPPGYAPPGYAPPGYAPPGYAPPGYGQQPSWGQPQWGAPVVTPGVVPLRPLTLGEILDGAVKVIRRYPRASLGMSAVVAVVTTILGLLAVLAQDFSSFADDFRSGGSSDGPGLTGADYATIPLLVIRVAAIVVLTGFLVVPVGKAVLGQQASFSDTWQQIKGRGWALIGLSLLTMLLSFGPILLSVLVAALLAVVSPVLLVIGAPLVLASVALGVYLYVRVSFAPAVLVLEKATFRGSLTRSGALVKGDWWRVFGILALVWLLSYLVSNVLQIPFAIIAGINLFANPDAGGFTVLFLVSQVGAGLGWFLIAPFAAAARALLYVDRRMRAEGLDLTLQAAARG